MLMSFVLSYTEDSLKELRRDILALSLRNNNYTFPRNQVSARSLYCAVVYFLLSYQLPFPCFWQIPIYGYSLYESFLVYGIVSM